MNAIYSQFLDAKRVVDRPSGLSRIPSLNPMLFDFQHDITSWALRRGRAAIFADCGLGKTPMQLEWALRVPGDVIIAAPLAVSQQTIREGEKFGIEAHYSRDGKKHGKITITNYEMLHLFTPSEFSGIVLDESSILKSYTGSFRNYVVDLWGNVPYRLAATATPAPNDYMELGNHAEFLGTMTRTEMLSMFFVHDGGETSKWRLKGHAESEFWKWLCSWAVMIRKPSDLGYQDREFILPPCHIQEMTVQSDARHAGFLFALEASTLKERQDARRGSIGDRVQAIAAMAGQSDEPWLLWCNLNDESAELVRAIPGAVEVKGSDSMESKEDHLLGFTAGKYRALVTKPRIAGFGMNWQHCHNMAFVGLSDSYEQFYQALRRCWRFGQKHPVTAHIVTSNLEGAVVANIKRKEADADRMAMEMVEHMHEINSANIRGTRRTAAEYIPKSKIKLPPPRSTNQLKQEIA